MLALYGNLELWKQLQKWEIIMSERLKGKVAIVTGGAKGIG